MNLVAQALHVTSLLYHFRNKTLPLVMRPNLSPLSLVLSSSSHRKATQPDKRNSLICESSVYNVALPFLVLSCYPLSVPVQTIYGRISAFSGFERSKFRHLWVFQRSSTVNYFAPCAAWALNRMCRNRDWIIRAAGYLRFG